MTPILEAHADTKIDLVAKHLRQRGTVSLKARGTSMLPSVWPGDLLTIQSAAHDEVVAGDMVLVLRDNRFFVHRLVGWRLGRGGLLLVTKGDAMPHDDPPAAASELLGRVANVCRYNRSFVPSRRISLSHSALAWMLCRWDRFRNLALRIHGVCQQASPRRAGEFSRDPFGAVRKIPNALLRSSHP